MLRAVSPLQTLTKCASALRERKNIKNRVTLATEIGSTLDATGLSSNERLIAQQIVAKLIEDEIEEVRRAIALSVAHSPHLPAELAEKLAQDIADISIPVLKLSPALEDLFLEEIIDSGAIDRMKAIACRQNLSKNLCRRIVAMGKKGPVLTLLENPSAQITNHTLTTIIRVYGDDGQIEQAVLDRGELPDDVINELCELTETHVSSFIERYFKLPKPVVDVQKGRNLLKTVKTNQITNDPSDWWDTKTGAV
ncbi:DUF2336 domain-containing protein [Terasakiella pusilla]|uniref:DUF2336 domain-containing protein n=1 Tax=Terasakiella pusilla TaxID=64973 RepID=UPI003AA882C3